MKNEARSLVRCRMAGIRAPCVYQVDFTTSELVIEKIENSITIRNHIYEYSKVVQNFNESNKRLVNNCQKDSASQLKETAVLENLTLLACKIGEVIGKLHKNNIIHGDLTTSNMLLVEPFSKSDVILIDFGLGYMEEKVEDKAVDLYVLERAVLSTHPNTEDFVALVFEEYKKHGGKSAKTVIQKLDEVRLRGRKKVVFG